MRLLLLATAVSLSLAGCVVSPQASAPAATEGVVGSNVKPSPRIVAPPAGTGASAAPSATGQVVASASVERIEAEPAMKLRPPESGASTTTDTGAIAGIVRAPGALVARGDETVPVQQTSVTAYDLMGTRLVLPAQTDAKGAFRLTGVPLNKLICLRTQFTFNGKDYYLSTLTRLEGAEGQADLTPMGTITEAHFFARCPGIAPKDDFVTEGFLDAFWTATDALQLEVPGKTVNASATLDDRTAAYKAMAARFAAQFAQGIDVPFNNLTKK